jgi:hypothetical protein
LCREEPEDGPGLGREKSKGSAEEKRAKKGCLRDEVEARVVWRQCEMQRSETALENPGQVGQDTAE